MIVGAGWAFVALVAAAIVAFLLAPSIGILVVDEAPRSELRLVAPALVDAEPGVEARSAPLAALSPGRAMREARDGLLRVRNAGCVGRPTGSGFALDPRILVASRDVLPGGGLLRVTPRTGRATAHEATRVYRLGELAIAQVGGLLPRKIGVGQDAALGASVAVVGYPLSSAPRVLAGVVVDRVAGARFGVRGPVLRLTSSLGPDEPGGPVVDARGRIVAVAFATDPKTGLAVAVPLATLRSLVASRALPQVPRCEGELAASSAAPRADGE
ncbi:MAG TPA: serine protease [Gaiella sp.]